MQEITVTKRLMRLNDRGSVGLGLPKKLSKQLGLTAESFVNISVSGNTMHIVKVQLD